MKQIDEYRNKHSGRVFLLGNGPSLLENDLSRLDPLETISMNRSLGVVPRPLYHCEAGDVRKQFNPKPRAILFAGQPEQCKKTNPGCPIVLVRTKLMGVKIPPLKHRLDIPERLDLRKGWPITHCGLLALHCAWWMGFNPIVLLGYDGYGSHFCEHEDAAKIDYVWKHKKSKLEFTQFIDELWAFDPYIDIINVNPKNEYGKLRVAKLEEV